MVIFSEGAALRIASGGKFYLWCPRRGHFLELGNTLSHIGRYFQGVEGRIHHHKNPIQARQEIWGRGIRTGFHL